MSVKNREIDENGYVKVSLPTDHFDCEAPMTLRTRALTSTTDALVRNVSCPHVARFSVWPIEP